TSANRSARSTNRSENRSMSAISDPFRFESKAVAQYVPANGPFKRSFPAPRVTHRGAAARIRAELLGRWGIGDDRGAGPRARGKGRAPRRPLGRRPQSLGLHSRRGPIPTGGGALGGDRLRAGPGRTAAPLRGASTH